MPALFWNKGYFREAGLTQPPQTFVEAMDYARKLVKFDSTGKMTRSGISLRLSGQGSGIGEKWRFLLEPAGGSLIARTPSGRWHQNYDNDAGRTATKFYVDAVQVYHVDDPKILHDADAFVSGTTAMLLREAWVIGEIRKKAPNLEYDVTPMPRWTADGPHKTLVGQDGLYVSAKSKNQQASYDFMKFLTAPESTVLLTQQSGWVGARTDVDWSPFLKQILQYEAFVRPPKDMQFYVDPAISPWNEIEKQNRRSALGSVCRSEHEGPAETRRVHPQVRDGHRRDPEGRGHVRHDVTGCRARPRCPSAGCRRAASASGCAASASVRAFRCSATSRFCRCWCCSSTSASFR
jgi:multiple sugar transport system substrate-binding protein